jgi:hypothetical protein
VTWKMQEVMLRWSQVVALAALLLAGVAAAGRAQQPSPEQVAAIRQSCRSDYIEHCSSVPTGSAAALNCLRQNEAHLAPACRQAIAAIGGGGPAAAGTAPSVPARPAEHVDAVELFREECGPDVRRLCHRILPGGGRMVGCLAENREALSPSCRSAMMELRERRQ